MLTPANVNSPVRAVGLPFRGRDLVALAKPITWFPPMWAFACGAVSAGGALADHAPALAVGLVVAGPGVCAASQMVNDWFDRHVDAINEPDRPIPSGRIPGRWGLRLAVLWSAASLLIATSLGTWVALATAVALALAWAYSAPPVRLKRDGWAGNAAVGLSYEGLAWVTGASVMLAGARPDARVLALAALYSIGAHGIMTLNDFKSVRGDRRMGVRSLPVQLGPARAARVACAVMLAAQIVVIALLARWQAPAAALVVAALLVAQLPLMRRFLAQPIDRARWYSGVGVPLYVLGMMAAAVGIRAAAGA
ncbi:MAG: chlorophyll synthase ChlG [Gemmatirosa sp.]